MSMDYEPGWMRDAPPPKPKPKPTPKPNPAPTPHGVIRRTPTPPRPLTRADVFWAVFWALIAAPIAVAMVSFIVFLMLVQSSIGYYPVL